MPLTLSFYATVLAERLGKLPLASLLISLTCFTAGLGATWAAEEPAVTVHRGVPATMRDGTVLRADIYAPGRPGKYPVLLQRTPYNKDGGSSFGIEAARRGYVVVIQDVRGRFTSEGEWYPFKYESQDGFDTVEWASSLPESNGKVGMFGGSYVGATQMLAAIAHPPHLAGICPVVTASNYHDGWTYQSGAFEQWFNESWTSGLAQNTFDRLVSRNTNAMQGAATLPLTDYPLFNTKVFDRNASSGPTLTATLAPYFLDWLAHPAYDTYWKRWSIEEHYASIAVPALTVAGWYDIFQGGAIRNYLGMKDHGANEGARRQQHLLVMIGGHAGSGRKIGDVDFGATAAEYDEDSVTLDWYDYLFKGARNDFANGKRVKLFVMGENQWRYEDDWPLARAVSTNYFLRSGGKANSLRGDGALSMEDQNHQSPQDREDQYVYDPAHPVPTTGGPLCCDAEHLPAGPRDQRSVETRDDVLVYSSDALADDVEVTGPIRLELYAKSSAVDTDFTGKLVDVWPDGHAQNLTEGIVRGRYRNSQQTADLMNPGQVYHLSIDMWSTGNVFRKGHRIRLEVSSSNFPRFDRNLNTGEDARMATRFVSATNTIYHDASHPSALVLPVVSRR